MTASHDCTRTAMMSLWVAQIGLGEYKNIVREDAKFVGSVEVGVDMGWVRGKDGSEYK